MGSPLMSVVAFASINRLRHACPRAHLLWELSERLGVPAWVGRAAFWTDLNGVWHSCENAAGAERVGAIPGAARSDRWHCDNGSWRELFLYHCHGSRNRSGNGISDVFDTFPDVRRMFLVTQAAR